MQYCNIQSSQNVDMSFNEVYYDHKTPGLYFLFPPCLDVPGDIRYSAGRPTPMLVSNMRSPEDRSGLPMRAAFSAFSEFSAKLLGEV